MAKPYNLVITADGHYGIVVGHREVFLANGLQVVLDEKAFAELQICGLLAVFEPGTAVPPADFTELITRRAIEPPAQPTKPGEYQWPLS
jgi:hypothetical protein